MKNFVKLFILSFLIPIFAGCKEDYHRAEGMVWNTTYHITYNGDKDLNDSICRILDEVSTSLNFFDNSSLLSKVNRDSSQRIDIHFRKVYDESILINAASAGAFDPTLGPLIDAWGFGKGHTATKDTLNLDSLLLLTGINRTKIKGDVLYKENPAIKFNFSAIAKGYGCDCIGEMLARNGADSYLVEIGGEISCAGKSPSGEKWRISIDKPIVTDSVLHESQCIIAVNNAGIATSGNYRNFHKDGATIYGHTISAITGRPVQTDVLSATVVASNCMEADGLATAIMALGSKGGYELALKMKVAVMMVLADGSVLQNDAFNDLTVSEP